MYLVENFYMRPEIKLEKEALDNNYTLNDEITYRFTLTNTGNMDLVNIRLEDTIIDASDIEFISHNGASISDINAVIFKPGDVIIAEGKYTITAADMDNEEILNVAEAFGTPKIKGRSYGEVTDKDNAKIHAKKTPAIELVKALADPSFQYDAVGQSVVYTFTVYNIGNDNLKDITVYDHYFDTFIALNDTKLDANKDDPYANSLTGTYTHIITQADLDRGFIDNIATVEGTGTTGEKVSHTDDETVRAKLQPAIEITKSTPSEKDGVSNAGDVITYTITIKNTGNVTLNHITLYDEMFGGEISLTNTSLAPNESMTLTMEYTVTQNDIENKEEIINTAITTGTPPGGEPGDPDNPSDEDDAKVPVTKDPKIALTKSANKLIDSEKDEEIIYTFVITNTGNVTLHDVTLYDAMLGGYLDLSNTTLAPGASVTKTFAYNATQADLDRGFIYNLARTEGKPPTWKEGDSKPWAEADVNIPVLQKPAIGLEKTANKEEVSKLYEEITYKFVITNKGNVTLDNITLFDLMLGGDINLTETTLAPGESTEIEVRYEVTQADLDRGFIHNDARTEGTPPNHKPGDDKPWAEDFEDVDVLMEAKIELSKIAHETVVDHKGQSIFYTLEITNRGNVTLTNVSLYDEMLGGDIFLSQTTLKPNESVSVTLRYEVTQADLNRGFIDNYASTEGTAPDGTKVEDDAEAHVGVERRLGIALDKSTITETVDKVDEEIVYKFVITNNSNVTLSNITLFDDMLGGYISLSETTLDPGESIEVEVTYYVTQEDLDRGFIHNDARTEGTPPGFEPGDDKLWAEDDEDVDVIQNASINLEKLADKPKVSKVGEEIEYTLTITNDGNVTLSHVTLEDPMLGGEIELEVDTLKPGESTEVKLTYTVTQEDLDRGIIENFATTTGTPPGHEPGDEGNVRDDDQEDVDVDQDARIKLVKEADEISVKNAGEVITYTITITNIGNVTLRDIILEDEMFGGNIDLDNTVLAPGESMTITLEYTVTQDDIDSKDDIINLAKTEGTPPGNEPGDPSNPKDEDEEEVPVAKAPRITLKKSADKDDVSFLGEEIVYTFVIANAGNVTLSQITLDDPMLGGNIDLEVDTLKPGDSTEVKLTYTVTQEDLDRGIIENVALTTGTPPGSEPGDPNNPKAEDDEDVLVLQNPSISLVKEANKDTVEELGEEIVYTFTITNDGNVTLRYITLDDEMLGGAILLEVDELKPGESTSVEVAYEVSQEDLDRGIIENVAFTEGTPPGHEPGDEGNPKDDDREDVPVTQKPAIQLEKTSDEAKVFKQGDTITYRFVVTNTGNVTLYDVKVNDEMLEDIGLEIILDKTELAPGESAEGSVEYVVSKEDVERGYVYNQAVAEGTPPNETEKPTDDDDHDVPVEAKAAISLEKTSELVTLDGDEKGHKIVYTFKVTNTGDILLKDVNVTDPMLNELGIEIILDKTELEVGESTFGYAEYFVTLEDLEKGEVYNVAKAEGTPPTYNPEDPNDPGKPSDFDDDHRPLDFTPGISLIKTSDKENISEVGEIVKYTFVITNTGNLKLSDIVLNDPMLGGDIALEISELAPNESYTITVEYRVTEVDLEEKRLVNTATVNGVSEYGQNVEDTDNDAINVQRLLSELVPTGMTSSTNVGIILVFLSFLFLGFGLRKEEE